jgi:hypothetical protein
MLDMLSTPKTGIKSGLAPRDFQMLEIPSPPRTGIKRGISRLANIRETAAYSAYVRISRWSVTQKSPF